MRRIAAIVSGASNVGPDQIAASLARPGGEEIDLQTEVVSSSTEATEAAKRAAQVAAIVVAVGGDGTVSDVATGIFGSSAALGIVPAGSTNIAARSLGIPAQPAAALALLGGSHRLRSIDVGRTEDRTFVHIAGAGLDAELFKGASPIWKRRLGWIAYLPAAVAALRLPPSDVRISTDGAVLEVRSRLVLIANGGSAVAPQFQIYPGITVDDGWLDVLVFTSSTPAEIATTLGFAGMQLLDRSPHVTHRRARNVEIEAMPPLPVELDGDPRGTTPRQFRVVPLGLRVVAPVIHPHLGQQQCTRITNL
ncbi:MAG TPA: diacylglycerol kinase family protein [Thermomicrobiales bacterium]|nr:diacylglycerol kinase family protein [Thermomicrobiales bacterium]